MQTWTLELIYHLHNGRCNHKRMRRGVRVTQGDETTLRSSQIFELIHGGNLKALSINLPIKGLPNQVISSTTFLSAVSYAILPKHLCLTRYRDWPNPGGGSNAAFTMLSGDNKSTPPPTAATATTAAASCINQKLIGQMRNSDYHHHSHQHAVIKRRAR